MKTQTLLLLLLTCTLPLALHQDFAKAQDLPRQLQVPEKLYFIPDEGFVSLKGKFFVPGTAMGNIRDVCRRCKCCIEKNGSWTDFQKDTGVDQLQIVDPKDVWEAEGVGIAIPQYKEFFPKSQFDPQFNSNRQNFSSERGLKDWSVQKPYYEIDTHRLMEKK